MGLRLRAARRSTAASSKPPITTATRGPTASRKPSGSASRFDRIYSITGIQFLVFNTLYQLYAACQSTPEVIATARAFATIPDLLNYWLTGELRAEFTMATTTQFVDARTRNWATGLLEELDIPTRLLPAIVEPGAVLGPIKRGRLRVARGRSGRSSRDARHGFGGRVGVRRRQDARSSARARGRCSAPSCTRRSSTAQARDLNFSNEGGVCGTTRLLKNIGGLWLLQACRRSWAAAGQELAYDKLLYAASRERRQFASLVRSGPPRVLPAARHGRRRSRSTAGRPSSACPTARPRSRAAFSKAWRSSTAWCSSRSKTVTGARFEEIRIVGGGSRNRLLNQFTADATGRTVVAGPSKRRRSATSPCRCSRPAPWHRWTRRADHRALVSGRTLRTVRVRRVGRAIRTIPGVRGDDLCLRRSRTDTKYLKNLWDDAAAAKLDGRPLDLLRYRSNLLGADLRITNFGGGNTSSKFDMTDPLTGQPQRVMAVKGSGGDLRSITNTGFAILYLDKLNSLIARYRGEAFEDEMVGFYPLCAFGENRVAASIDTPLHAFLPFPHVDHLHPDWAIALAASANGQKKMEEFNRQYGRKIIWVPWQRPGFELGVDVEARGGVHAWLRRVDSWRPRALHVGTDAEGVLSQQHPHHRRDGGFHSGAHRGARASRSSAARR